MAVYARRDQRKQESLPYTQLEYIQSTGTQYINTGFKPKYNSRIIADISNVPNASNIIIYGVRDTSSATAANQFVFLRKSATTIRSDYFGTNKSANVNDTTARNITDKNKNVLTAYNVTVTNTAVNSGICTNSLYLFALNDSGIVSLQSAYRLYSCKIYDNDILVRDYIPVRLKTTMEVGLWDKVGKIFYGNAGTGTFTAGEVAA